MQYNFNGKKFNKQSYSLKDMFLKKQETITFNPYINHEFQDYGYELAKKLDDLMHKGLYIKLARNHSRTLLESAYSFVADYPKAKNKGRLFMWKLNQLKQKNLTQSA